MNEIQKWKKVAFKMDPVNKLSFTRSRCKADVDENFLHNDPDILCWLLREIKNKSRAEQRDGGGGCRGGEGRKGEGKKNDNTRHQVHFLRVVRERAKAFLAKVIISSTSFESYFAIAFVRSHREWRASQPPSPPNCWKDS